MEIGKWILQLQKFQIMDNNIKDFSYEIGQSTEEVNTINISVTLKNTNLSVFEEDEDTNFIVEEINKMIFNIFSKEKSSAEFKVGRIVKAKKYDVYVMVTDPGDEIYFAGTVLSNNTIHNATYPIGNHSSVWNKRGFSEVEDYDYFTLEFKKIH